MRSTTSPPGQAQHDVGARAPLQATRTDDPLLDHARLQMLRDLEPEESSVLNRAVASFLEKSPGALSQISHAVLRRSAADVTQAAYALKGSALNLGVPRVAALCARLQDIGSSADLRHAPAVLALLTAELDAAMEALRALEHAEGRM